VDTILAVDAQAEVEAATESDPSISVGSPPGQAGSADDSRAPETIDEERDL
jgi:hypothetical protein